MQDTGTAAPLKNHRIQELLLNPERSLIRLSIPIMFGMGIYILYSIADMIFVGRLGGDAIAAVTFCGSFFFLMFALSSVSVGAQSLIAQRMGAGDHAGANNAAFHALLLGISLGIGFFFAGRPLAEDMLRLVGAQGQALTLGTRYLEIIFLGAPFFFCSASFRAILTGEGDTRTPVIILAMSTGVNILLDPIFIFLLGWGVPGAAWATLIATLTSFAAFLYYLFVRRTSYVSLTRRSCRPSWKILRKILDVGFPASLTQLIMSLGAMFLHRIISIFGSEAVAGYGLGTRVDMVIILPFVGISTALLTLVGMCYGASRGDLVNRISSYAIKKSLLASLVFGSLVYLFAEPILWIFTIDESVVSVGKTYLRYIAFAYPMIAFVMNSGRILQGLGLGLPSLVITSTRVLLVSVPLAYLFTRVWGMTLASVWVAILISGCISTLISFVWLRSSLGSVSSRLPPLSGEKLTAEIPTPYP